MAKYVSKTWEEVKEGDELPPVKGKLTVSKCVVNAAGTRDFFPGHHDRDFAQQKNGVKDMFLQTQHFQAFLDRVMNEWAGPEGWIRKRTISMRNSIFPGDDIIVTGKVVKKYQEGAEKRVDLELMVSNQDGPCCPASATMILPVKG